MYYEFLSLRTSSLRAFFGSNFNLLEFFLRKASSIRRQNFLSQYHVVSLSNQAGTNWSRCYRILVQLKKKKLLSWNFYKVNKEACLQVIFMELLHSKYFWLVLLLHAWNFANEKYPWVIKQKSFLEKDNFRYNIINI